MKLHPTSSDHESSDNAETVGKVDEFLSIEKNQDKELNNRLKALKSELAAKAKESLEKKISETASSSQNVDVRQLNVENKRMERSREMEIAKAGITEREKQQSMKERENEKKSKPNVKALKMSGNDDVSSSKKKESKETSRVSRKSRSASKSSRR